MNGTRISASAEKQKPFLAIINQPQEYVLKRNLSDHHAFKSKPIYKSQTERNNTNCFNYMSAKIVDSQLNEFIET